MENRTISPLEGVMEQVKAWARVNSPWALHFNSGSCNGCDIEILATLTPRYDVERFGIKLQASPRHADVLVCTGPVTRQARERLLRIYEQMPEPRFVVAVGSCAISGGAFQGCYNVMEGIDKVIPVNAYIPGCPPRPEAIIDGIVKLLGSLQGVTPAPLGVDGKPPVDEGPATNDGSKPASEAKKATAPIATSAPAAASTAQTATSAPSPEPVRPPSSVVSPDVTHPDKEATQ